MNYHHRQRRALVTGISGSGKSTLALYLARTWSARWRFVFDPDREFAIKLGWPVAISEPEIFRLAAQFRPVCYDPIPSYGGDLEAALQRFCAVVLAMSRKVNGVKLLCIDEVWKYTGRKLPPALKAIQHEGRRQEIDTLIVSQQLNDTNAALRGQTTELWAFKQTDRRPLEWLDEAGFDSEAVKALSHPGGFIVKDNLRVTFRHGRTGRNGAPVFSGQSE